MTALVLTRVGDADPSARVPDESLLREIAHTLVDPLTELHGRELQRSESLMTPIRDKMTKQGYASWKVVVNEHIVRAIVVRRIGWRQGDEAAREAQWREVNSGFIYLPLFVQWLGEFDRERSKYPRFSDFYPVLLKVLESRAGAQASGRFLPAWQPLASGGRGWSTPRGQQIRAAGAPWDPAPRAHAGPRPESAVESSE
jgi:hypothetical protein